MSTSPGWSNSFEAFGVPDFEPPPSGVTKKGSDPDKLRAAVRNGPDVWPGAHYIYVQVSTSFSPKRPRTPPNLPFLVSLDSNVTPLPHRRFKPPTLLLSLKLLPSHLNLFALERPLVLFALTCCPPLERNTSGVFFDFYLIFAFFLLKMVRSPELES